MINPLTENQREGMRQMHANEQRACTISGNAADGQPISSSDFRLAEMTTQDVLCYIPHDVRLWHGIKCSHVPCRWIGWMGGESIRWSYETSMLIADWPREYFEESSD